MAKMKFESDKAPRRWTAQLLRDISQLWFPTFCLGCGVYGQSPCERCCELFCEPPDEPCPKELTQLSVVLSYDDNFRVFWSAVKNNGNRKVLRWFAEHLAMVIEHEQSNFDIITWAPTSPARRRQRGFDQAQLLAQIVAKHFQMRAVPTLNRRRGRPQTGRNRQQRLAGVEFSARRTITGSVLLCDDIVTTGATMNAAAQALMQAGAQLVSGAAVARTPAVNNVRNWPR